MKLAIVQDDLVRKAGAEQVTLSFHHAFPDATIYTLSYDPEVTFQEFKHTKIKTSWFGRLVKAEKNMKRFFFPFGVLAMKQLHIKNCDVVLQSTTHCAKYVKTDPDTLIITYCHTPFRLVWRPDSYEIVSKSGIIKRKLYDFVISILKKIEIQSAKKTDWFITNSIEVVPRIKLAYNPINEISIINPSVKCKNFYVVDSISDYYLIVSRFEYYKRIDLVIEAFNDMKNKKLVIVGKGAIERELKSLASKNDNISFYSGLDASKLADLYSRCKAFIFPQLEDYGITPLEANASGRPVIAYGKGGVLDTMLPYEDDASRATAVFFSMQTKDSLKSAIALFENLTFNPAFIRSHAELFDEEVFVKKIRDFVFEKYRLKEAHQ